MVLEEKSGCLPEAGGSPHRTAAGVVAADLDDPDFPAYTTGRAAELLGVRQAFLRSLDAAGAVVPQRSAGGRRRYSRRQLALAARIREQFDQGHTLSAAVRILALEDDLAAERALTASLLARFAARDAPQHSGAG